MIITFTTAGNRNRYLKDFDMLKALLEQADKLLSEEFNAVDEKVSMCDEVRIEVLLRCHKRKLFVLRYEKVASTMIDVLNKLSRYLNIMLKKVSEDEKVQLEQTIQEIRTLLDSLKINAHTAANENRAAFFNTEQKYKHYQRILPIMREKIPLWKKEVENSKVLGDSASVKHDVCDVQGRMASVSVSVTLFQEVFISPGINVLDAPIEGCVKGLVT